MTTCWAGRKDTEQNTAKSDHAFFKVPLIMFAGVWTGSYNYPVLGSSLGPGAHSASLNV